MKEPERWATAITDVQPNKIRVRGYSLPELMETKSFTQVVYLIWTGNLPTPAQEKILNMILVAGIDHGGSPPSTLAARTVASTGSSLNGALAAGILSINKNHGGAVEDCMHLLQEIAEVQNMEEKALKIVRRFREEKRNIPGIGHRVHTNDPRVAELFENAERTGLAGRYVQALKVLHARFMKETGKEIPINVDGGMAALLWEIGIKPKLANAVFMLARVPGLVAHIVEEGERQKPMRRIDPAGFYYDGPEL